MKNEYLKILKSQKYTNNNNVSVLVPQNGEWSVAVHEQTMSHDSP